MSKVLPMLHSPNNQNSLIQVFSVKLLGFRELGLNYPPVQVRGPPPPPNKLLTLTIRAVWTFILILCYMLFETFVGVGLFPFLEHLTDQIFRLYVSLATTSATHAAGHGVSAHYLSYSAPGPQVRQGGQALQWMADIFLGRKAFE